MEGIVSALIFISLVLVIFGGFQYIAEKYFGVRFHGKFGYLSARNRSETEKELVNQLQNFDTELVQRAIERCKKKKYKLTYGNILNEIHNEDPFTLMTNKSENTNVDIQVLSEADLKNKVDEFNKSQPPKLNIKGDPKKIKFAIDICIVNGIEPTEENVKKQLQKNVFAIDWESK